MSLASHDAMYELFQCDLREAIVVANGQIETGAEFRGKCCFSLCVDFSS